MTLRTLLLAAILLAAPAGAQAMEEAAFTAAMRATNSDNPHQAIARMERLLQQDGLTNDQQALLYYMIGLNYGTTALDKPKAIEAYERMLAIAPEHRLAPNARNSIDYANTQLGHIRGRLTGSHVTASDLMSDGRWQEVNERLATRTVTLTEIDARNMYYAGWFCTPGLIPVGSENTEQKLVGPCPQRRDPLHIDALKILW